ncbi:MAG: hypothetical protein AMXMBFR77_24350 [Phycisphaerales bacterium]|nr:hypothetical protein [Leptolyngbya sp.]MCZ7631880.1 M14 family zinc carboxypeptidase [Phycisphaerales bacterium]MDL1905356.1 hypothetical protein [Synechococcales cyanobacterium CNB]GIK20313.1 MAG: hypothetical protein BroJett004_24770 [Planctomycetota bacterium]
MRRIATAITLVLGSGIAAAQPLATGPVARIDGHKVVRLDIRGPADLRFMEAIGADQWSHGIRPGVPTDFMVSPDALAAIDQAGLRYRVVVHDVQSLIDAENERLRRGGEGGKRAWFDDFRTLAEIDAYMGALAAQRPDIASVFNVGLSIEGRTIRALRIANDAFGDLACKPTILFNACQHSREWISPMVAMYAADRLVAAHGADPDLTALIDRAEIIFIPVVNPDGYHYTWTTNRLWRKNRRNNGNGTFGVDLNRNWGVGWGLNSGSSGSGSSETYRGTAPFSEPETDVVRALAESRPRLAAHVDLHSYGQLLLAPWGYTADLPPGHATFQMLGAEMQQIIKSVHNRTYVHGPTYTVLYPISGGATDWFWGDRDAHSFLFELRGSGFILPPEEIIPNGEEILPALVHLAAWAREGARPPADFNDDASVNTLDVLAFLNAWVAQDDSADMNGDGTIDSLDVLAFLNAWAGGC